MFRWFLHRQVRGMETKYGYNAAYIHELADESLSAFLRFATIQTAGGTFRTDAPTNAWFAAGIAGALMEDCGSCVQIASDKAIERGMKAETIAALLSGTPTDPDAQLGFDYGRALIAAAANLDDLREKIETKWGRRALLALTLGVMTARNFPVIKRALGHAKTCQRVRIGKDDIAVNQALKAA